MDKNNVILRSYKRRRRPLTPQLGEGEEEGPTKKLAQSATPPQELTKPEPLPVPILPEKHDYAGPLKQLMTDLVNVGLLKPLATMVLSYSWQLVITEYNDNDQMHQQDSYLWKENTWDVVHPQEKTFQTAPTTSRMNWLGGSILAHMAFRFYHQVPERNWTIYNTSWSTCISERRSRDFLLSKRLECSASGSGISAWNGPTKDTIHEFRAFENHLVSIVITNERLVMANGHGDLALASLKPPFEILGKGIYPISSKVDSEIYVSLPNHMQNYGTMETGRVVSLSYSAELDLLIVVTRTGTVIIIKVLDPPSPSQVPTSNEKEQEKTSLFVVQRTIKDVALNPKTWPSEKKLSLRYTSAAMIDSKHICVVTYQGMAFCFDIVQGTLVTTFQDQPPACRCACLSPICQNINPLQTFSLKDNTHILIAWTHGRRAIYAPLVSNKCLREWNPFTSFSRDFALAPIPLPEIEVESGNPQ
jgi:hypothetical protein